jgi:diaminopropionate ammonia-lyase
MLPSAFPVRYLLNPKANSSSAFGEKRESVLGPSAHEAAFREVSSWPGYLPTPLLKLVGLGRRLGVGSLWYKDEGTRFGLGSFKALGGMYGVYQVLRDHILMVTGSPGISSRALLAGSFSDLLSEFTVCCASAGNHGKAVARGAQMFGCRCVVYLPSKTSPQRVEAIRALGATTVPVDGGFDDGVEQAAEEAAENGWSVVADTTFPGYEEVPRHIMQGYTILAREVLDQLGSEEPVTHVFLQAGVGGLAAAVAGHLWYCLGENRPKVVVVEPSEADCLLESCLRGRIAPSAGTLDTSMECLACREVSAQAWQVLEEGADAFLSISDTAAAETVELLARGSGADPEILTQPSGAAGLTGLIAASFEPGLSGPLNLGSGSRVLVIGSEGPQYLPSELEEDS